MILCVCSWKGMKMNVVGMEEYIVLWGWEYEYVIFKDIEVIQENDVIWGGKEDCGLSDKQVFKYMDMNNSFKIINEEGLGVVYLDTIDFEVIVCFYKIVEK